MFLVHSSPRDVDCKPIKFRFLSCGVVFLTARLTQVSIYIVCCCAYFYSLGLCISLTRGDHDLFPGFKQRPSMHIWLA